MPSINIRQLRETRRLKALLAAGETVELRERDRVIARIVPAHAMPITALPDFDARGRALFGDRRFSGADIVVEERGRF